MTAYVELDAASHVYSLPDHGDTFTQLDAAPIPIPGAWRSLHRFLCGDEMDSKFPFAYSISTNKDPASTFPAFFENKYSTCVSKIDLSSGFILIPTTPSKVKSAAAWIHHQSHTFIFTRLALYDSIENGDGYFYLGYLTRDRCTTFKHFVRIQDAPRDVTFKFEARADNVLDLYCRATREYCATWVENNVGKEVKVEIPGIMTFPFLFESPECQTCGGMHLQNQCYFDQYLRQTTDNSPPDDLNYDLFTSVSAIMPLLRRPHLVQTIIERVKRDKLLLIEAPPCTGKTILLVDIASTVRRSPCYVFGFIQRHSQSVGSPATATPQWKTTRWRFSEDLPPDYQSALNKVDDQNGFLKLLQEILASSPKLEFWLFIDEAQVLYDNEKFWQNFQSLYVDAKFYFVTAGTYSSRSYSSYPPKQCIPVWNRMNLFPLEVDSVVAPGIAFTEDEFHSFVDQCCPIDKDLIPRREIIAYASPSSPDPTWERFIHPGVAVELTKFITNTIGKPSFSPPLDWQEAIGKFRDMLISGVATSFSLGRCVPRNPVHLRGLPGPLLQVFSKILDDQTVLVPPIDSTIRPVVFVNHNVPTVVTLSSLAQEHSIPVPTTEDSTTSEFQIIVKYLNRDLIAATPRDRIQKVILGQVSDSSLSCPYSVRDCIDSSPISEYDQAAHDARRMGWLVQDPVKEHKIPLRLPTQWHYEYLAAFIRPKPIPEEVKTISFDEFLVRVIRRFHASVINPTKTNPNEALYSQEFSRATADFACSYFLLPQVPTAMKDGLGEGRVDYLCMTRRWFIELMREGDKRADHLARFKKDGAYCRAWKDWDWRVVDFYFETEPTSKALEEPNYRAVLLRRVEQALKITIKGLGMAEVTWDVYG